MFWLLLVSSFHCVKSPLGHATLWRPRYFDLAPTVRVPRGGQGLAAGTIDGRWQAPVLKSDLSDTGAEEVPTLQDLVGLAGNVVSVKIDIKPSSPIVGSCCVAHGSITST